MGKKEHPAAKENPKNTDKKKSANKGNTTQRKNPSKRQDADPFARGTDEPKDHQKKPTTGFGF